MKYLQFGLTIVCLLFLFSCQKEESPIPEQPVITTAMALEEIIGDNSLMDQFFNGPNDHDVPVSASNKATVDEIKLAMAKDHQTTPFVSDYIRQVGFPLWGQAKLHRQEGGGFLYALPFAKSNSTFATAILHIVLQQEAYVYELALRTDVNDYLAAYANGNQTFYWENLLSFLAGFNNYDRQIFNFSDALFNEWFGQNKDTYLTDVADTRGCETYVYTACKWNITLQESGDTRSLDCDGITYQIVVTICGEEDNTSIPGSHTPGGQIGGVPGIGGSGGSSGGNSPGGDNNGSGNSPGLDPGTWGDEGSNGPGNIPTMVMDNFLDELEQQGQLNWFNRSDQDYLRSAITSRIFGMPPDFSVIPNAHLIVDVMEKYGVKLQADVTEYLLLLNDIEILSESIEFLENNDDDYSIKSVEIFMNLTKNNLLNVNTNNLNSAQSTKIKKIFEDAFTGSLLGHRQLSAESWLKIVQKQHSSLNCNDCSWFESFRKTINEGWNTVFKPFKDGLQTAFTNLGNAIPGADQEWTALLTVYGPMLTELGLDIGTDFIPGVGELKSFYKCSNAYAAGKYGEAALEFIGGIAGILPVGDLISAGSNIVVTGVKVFAAYKVIKAIANVSSGIFGKISSLGSVSQGWNFIWDDGLKKLIFKNNAGDEVADIATRNIDGTDVATTTVRRASGWSLFRRADMDNLTPVSPGGTNNNYFSSTVLNQNSRRISVTEPADIANLSQAIRNGDPDGLLTEELADKMFREIYPDNTGRIWGNGASHNSSGHGLDNVVQLPDGTLVIAECKPLSSSGTISLGTPSAGTQMSTDWIYDAADKMIDQTGNPALQNWGNTVKNALDNGTPIERVLIAVDKNNGDIIITKLNAFN